MNSSKAVTSPDDVDVKTLADLCTRAAYGQIMISLSHEFTNQQNGVQINAHLVQTLASQRTPDLHGLGSAAKRLLSDSRRTVEMFSLWRLVGQAIDTGSDRAFDPAPLVGPFFEHATARRERLVEQNVDWSGRLSAPELIAVAGFLLGLRHITDEPVSITFAGDRLTIAWAGLPSEEFSSLEENFAVPALGRPLLAALPLTFDASRLHLRCNKHQGSGEVELTELARQGS
ncbi:MAG: hypothetical protein AAF662_10670 [Pseudomonadota bacterium]